MGRENRQQKSAFGCAPAVRDGSFNPHTYSQHRPAGSQEEWIGLYRVAQLRFRVLHFCAGPLIHARRVRSQLGLGA